MDSDWNSLWHTDLCSLLQTAKRHGLLSSAFCIHFHIPGWNEKDIKMNWSLMVIVITPRYVTINARFSFYFHSDAFICWKLYFEMRIYSHPGESRYNINGWNALLPTKSWSSCADVLWWTKLRFIAELLKAKNNKKKMDSREETGISNYAFLLDHIQNNLFFEFYSVVNGQLLLHS